MSALNRDHRLVKDTFEIGRILREKRKSQGLTLEQVAQHCGLSMRFVSEVERGKPTAEFGKVLFLLNAVGVDLYASTRE
jgi:HTH-type transcriptional regulator/antitoxin HipB